MNKEIVPIEQIAESICWIRGHKVSLDSDLALSYGVATKVLNQAVKRNRERFSNDFMFQLNADETEFLRSQFVALRKRTRTNWSQIVTSSEKHRGKRYRRYAFTEQCIAMLPSMLNSDRAIKVNIAIMRAFVKLRHTLESNRELARTFSELERRRQARRRHCRHSGSDSAVDDADGNNAPPDRLSCEREGLSPSSA